MEVQSEFVTLLSQLSFLSKNESESDCCSFCLEIADSRQKVQENFADFCSYQSTVSTPFCVCITETEPLIQSRPNCRLKRGKLQISPAK
jgi:hypothetical protein